MKMTELSKNILSSFTSKTTLVVLTAFAVLAATVSCTKEQTGTEPGIRPLHFSATHGDDTKTTLNGTRVHWTLNDEIALWYGALGSEMNPADYFVGEVDGSDARKATLYGFAENNVAFTYLAVYPRSASLDCSKKGKLTVGVPSVQNLTEEGFDPKAAVSVAVLEDGNFSFRNVGGLMALQINGAGGHVIKEIRLAGTSSLSGEVEIKKDNLPDVSAITDGTNCAVLCCPEGLMDSDDFLGGNEPYTPENGDWGEAHDGNEGFGSEPGSWDSSPASVSLYNAGNVSSEGVTDKSTKAYTGFNSFYLVTLPGTHTNFSITLIDADGCTAVAKSTTPFTIERNGNTLIAKITAPSGVWPTAPKVYVNEIHTHNNQIELWNPNDFSVDLTGWLLVKDEKSWAFPVGSVIPAKGYKVITAGQEKCEDGPMFGISGDKGFVLSLVSGSTVDKVDNSGEGKRVIGTTETYGRKTDGSGEWVVFIDDGTIFGTELPGGGTCDGDNSKGTVKGDEPVPVIDYTGLVINELNGNDYDTESGNGNDKYVELYNGSAGELDLTGVVMKKDGETVWTGAKEKHVLAPGAYLVLYSSKSEGAKTCPADNVFSGGLSPKKAVRVQLLTPGGESIDDFNYATYSGTPAPASYGRNSGSGGWYYQTATPGAVNADGTDKVTGLQ